MSLSLFGDVASIAGLLIAIVGFVATIREARKAKEASEQARLAASVAVSRITSQLLVNEVGECLGLVRQATKACREGNWGVGMDQCEEAIIRFAHLIDHQKLMKTERDSMGSAIVDLRKMVHYISSLRKSNVTKDLPAQKANVFHEIILLLCRVEARLQSEAMEV